MGSCLNSSPRAAPGHPASAATHARRPTQFRHSRSCRSREGKRCDCRPSWEAWAYSKRDDKIRRTFPTLAAAKAWRADALNALNRGRLRAPTPLTLNRAAAEFLAGARDGSTPNRSGHTYKPAALRGYERSLRERIVPMLGPMRLSMAAARGGDRA